MRPRQASIHALLCTDALAISTPALSDTITVKSAGGSDTAEENIGTGAVGTSSLDLEMMTEGSEPQLVEFIFRNTGLPDDATICEAFITFTASEVNIGFDPADLTISGELTDDASDIKGGDDNLSNRAQTLASVNWQPAEWTVVDQTHQTPSLATVIQEIVDSLGPGDDTDELGIFVQGQGTRHTYSEDDSPSDAAELTVEYFTPGSSCASPTVYQDRVDGGNRDGEEDLRDGDMSRSDDTIELGIEDDTKQYVGIRFDSIEIPQGSTINSAVIDFTVDEVNDAPTSTYPRFQSYDVDASASVDIVPDGQPDLLLMKTRYMFDDPVSANPEGDPDTPTPNAKSIPGATKVYTMTVINSGPGSVDTDSIVLTDAIPDRLVLRVADFDSGKTGTIAYDPGTSGLAATLNFVSLSDLNDDVQFSTDGSNFDYVPTPDPLGLDASVTHLRINPKGAMAGASGSNVSFSVSFKVRLE